MSEYPRPDELTVFLSEDVRTELYGKFSILGFYPGDEINVKDIGPQSIIPLTMMFMFAGKAAGNYAFKVEVVSPGGKSIGSVNGRIEKLANRGVVQIVKLTAFPLLETGDWKINIHLDNVAYYKKFKVTNLVDYFKS